jgi:hypothetical protein
MGWAWDLRTDMVKRYGPVLGQQFTEQIVVPTIVANAPRLQDQILEIFLLDDDDANLSNGTPNYLSLEAASIKRTIPFPKIDVGTLAVTPLNGTDQQLTPRIVRANLVTLISKFDKVELVYDIGAGPQRRFMVPSGTANEYIALLPGVLSPTDVTYYVEATHSTAKVLRAPEFGEFGYSVGQEELFFADDFETVQPGWSTGALLGAQNDFSRGRPVGRAGTSWNVAWSDPNGAFSGNNSWGNNLNGAYLPQYAAFLRAPKLDLTGKTNVRLRFMRWLQVQDNSYDQAKILLDGNQVWANPWGSHLVDRGWTKFDLRLPGADNNPAAEIEWQLIADGGLELAGWNIDDVSLYSFKVLPPPVFQFVLNPAQVDLGKPGTASLKGTANAPVLLLFSTSNGPLNVPGLPTLHVGSNFVPIAAALNGSGELKVNFTAPSAASASGQLTYCQGLELTSPTTVTASNPTVLMWGR